MLSQDSTIRKGLPMARGLLDYFPDALAAVSAVSMAGAQKHGTFDAEGNPTWDKSKSTDHADCIVRHLADRGQFQKDGHRHSAALAWRALALLQIELDNDKIAASGINQFAEFEGLAQKLYDEEAYAGMGQAAGAAQMGLDLTQPGTDRTAVFIRPEGQTWVLYGDNLISVQDIASILGVSRENVIDRRPKSSAAKEPSGKVAPDLSPAEVAKASIPAGIWWCKSCATFHVVGLPDGSGTDGEVSVGFVNKWLSRRGEFPQNRREALKTVI